VHVRLNEKLKFNACITVVKQIFTDTEKIFDDGKYSDSTRTAWYKESATNAQNQLAAVTADKQSTVEDCNNLHRTASAHKDRTLKWAGTPAAVNPALDTCKADLKKVATESQSIFLQGVANKTIDASEASTYKAREATMQKQYDAAMADKNMSQAECSGLLQSVNELKAMAVKMVATVAAPPTPVAPPAPPAPAIVAIPLATPACLAQYKSISAEANKLMEDGAKAGKITALEASIYKANDATLQRQYDSANMDGRITQDECNALVRSATLKRTTASSMAAR
jgi:hypothetical protein